MSVVDGWSFPRRHGKLRPHPAVDVHPQDPELGTAIRCPPAARDAPTAIDIRFHHATIARPRAPGGSLPGSITSTPSSCPEHARIREEGLLSRESVKVRAADADAMHAYQHVTGRQIGSGAVGDDEAAGLFERDLNHEAFRRVLIFASLSFLREG